MKSEKKQKRGMSMLDLDDFKDITYCQEQVGFEDGPFGRLKDYPQSDIYIAAWQLGRETRYRHMLRERNEQTKNGPSLSHN